VPTGIATDSFNQHFFSDLVRHRAIVELIGYENEAFIFPSVHHSFKFCTLVLTGPDRGLERTKLAFYCRKVEDAGDPRRWFDLSRDDFARMNPNTLTCPVFRTGCDARLSLKLYEGVPVLVDNKAGSDPWQFRGLLMFMMNSDSGLFETQPGEDKLPLY